MNSINIGGRVVSVTREEQAEIAAICEAISHAAGPVIRQYGSTKTATLFIGLGMCLMAQASSRETAVEVLATILEEERKMLQ